MRDNSKSDWYYWTILIGSIYEDVQKSNYVKLIRKFCPIEIAFYAIHIFSKEFWI